MSHFGRKAVVALFFCGIACGKDEPAATTPATPATQPATAPIVRADTYTGEGLTLVLTKSGNAFTGTITLGDKSFVAKGTASSDQAYAGTFENNGKSYEWSAAVTGNNMRFKTGESEYALVKKPDDSDNPLAKKKGDDNPLSRRAEPANPLAQPKTTANPLANPPTDAPSPTPNPLAQPRSENPLAQPTQAAVQARAALAPQQSMRTNNPGKSIKFRRLSIHDPGINNIEAFSFLIPEGWKPDGGITWFGDYSILCNLLLKITDPQSGAQIEFLPIQNFTHLSNPVIPMAEGTNYMGNIVHRPIEDMGEIVTRLYAPKAAPHLANAKLESRERLAKVEQLVQKNWGGQSSVKSERLRYAYELNGAPWNEDVYLTAVYTPTQLGVFWSVTSACALRAPRGVLDQLTPLMTATVSSCHMSPDWYGGYMYVQKLFNNRQMQGIANAKAISDTITRNSEEIRKTFADSYRQQQESQDRISQARSETMRGVETYQNPYEGRPVELPSGYNNAWVNRQGEYVLSDTAGFDPNVGSTQEWSQLKLAK